MWCYYCKSAYRDHNSNYGWDADHIKLAQKGETDALPKLQSLHWRNNANKGDGPDRPSQYSVVKK